MNQLFKGKTILSLAFLLMPFAVVLTLLNSGGFLKQLITSILIEQSCSRNKTHAIGRNATEGQISYLKERKLKPGDLECYIFEISGDESVFVEVSDSSGSAVDILELDSNRLLSNIGQDDFFEVTDEGEYLVRFRPKEFEITLSIGFGSLISDSEEKNDSLVVDNSVRQRDYSGEGVPSAEVPNSRVEVPFYEDENLQQIVGQVLALVEEAGFPKEDFSVSLIDLSDSPCCSYASFQHEKNRYPASITKLFWGVMLYSQFESGELLKNDIPPEIVEKMLHDSDNDAASFVVDQITSTESGADLSEQELDEWLRARYSLNSFFIDAGYDESLNISQKNFPLSNMSSPTGRDLQIREPDRETPIRNSLSTYDISRLLYELYSGKLLLPNHKAEIMNYLYQDLDPGVWAQKEYSSVEGFLGEGLPSSALIHTKVGWTSSSRQEAAIIESADGSARYILVLIGENPIYADNEEIFPMISRLVYEGLH